MNNQELWKEWLSIKSTAFDNQEAFINSLPKPELWSIRQRETVKAIIAQNKSFRDQIEDGIDISSHDFCF